MSSCSISVVFWWRSPKINFFTEAEAEGESLPTLIGLLGMLPVPARLRLCHSVKCLRYTRGRACLELYRITMSPLTSGSDTSDSV